MKKISILVLILIPSLAAAQVISNGKNESYVRKDSHSFFDPSKLIMRQSYSFGYYSGGGNSGSVGYYLNSLEYSFSSPLKIRLDLGYLHSPSAMFSGGSGSLNSGVVVPGVSLDWRPSKNFNFRLDYRQVPVSGLGRDNRYYNPYYGEDYR